MHESKPEGISDGSVQEQLDQMHQALSALAIAQLRIYDVLMSLYGETNHEDAVALANLHKQGKLRGELPFLDM